MAERTAVVLGASIAGLCAARTLADRVDRVIVVDRDTLPAGIDDRSGVPQARHVHQLLIRGRQMLESLFPGFEAEMCAGGAVVIDFLRDFATLRPNGWWRPVSSGYHTLSASRALIESVVRARLRAHDRVEFRERTDVRGLVIRDGRVRAVSVASREGGGAGEIEGELVVDACGRASHAPQWLAAAGLPPVAETVVDSHTGYVTRWFRAPDPWPSAWWWKGVWLDPVDLGVDLAGVLSPIEGGRWIVTLGGAGSLLPSSDEAGFADGLGRLRAPLIAEALSHAEPIGPVWGNRETANRFRHYERWPGRLPGFVALGDSACKFNPVYGQGMTTAATSAELLGRLASDLDVAHPDLPRKFFRAQAALARDPWTIATAADFRFPATTGARPPFHASSTRYMDALFAASAVDPILRKTLGDVIHMLRTPNALFAPSTVLRVLRARLGSSPRPLALDELAHAHAELAA